MKITQTEIDEFLKLSQHIPILDARSEKEWAAGHIPGSINFPVLNDEERAKVGTCYKQKGHEAAVMLGYELTGPKFSSYIKKAYQHFKERKVLIHCWRGGLRSRIMAYLLESAGFEVTLLTGGYKQYRHRAIEKFELPMKLCVLGGYTGTGKTEVLKRLAESGKQVIDIENMASHRGSAFGNIGLSAQPSQEQFENLLATEISKHDLSKPVWIEDEARLTGVLKIPDVFFEKIRTADFYFIDLPASERMQNIMQEYGRFDRQELVSSTEKLRKRLGDLKTTEAINFLEEGNYLGWLEIVLAYYDKTYGYGLSQRDPTMMKKYLSVKEFMKDVTEIQAQ